VNFATVRFIFDEVEARRILYANFNVIEPIVGGAPVYIGSCRDCGRMIVRIPRGGQGEVDARPILEALDHVQAHERRT
jgi:hypothetical protein